MTVFGSGAEAISLERQRQIEEEGYTPERDDRYVNSELLAAAQCYVELTYTLNLQEVIHDHVVPETWPWEESYWKPSDDPYRNLARAGALAQAELDRLGRTIEDGAQERHAKRLAAEAVLVHCCRTYDAGKLATAKPVNADAFVAELMEGSGVAGSFSSGYSLMGRTADGRPYTIKDVEIEHHDRETSTGGTTVWLTIEEY